MHRCVRCGNLYEDNDATILRGCGKCGAIFFLYLKDPQDAKQLDTMEQELQKKDTTLEKELIKEIEKKKAEGVEEVAEEIAEIREIPEKPEEKIAPKRVPKKARKKIIPVKVVEKEKIAIERRPRRGRRARKEVVRVGKAKFAVEDTFGIETIRVPKDGVYEINISALMKKRPIIVLEKGKVYFIHLPSAFEEMIK